MICSLKYTQTFDSISFENEWDAFKLMVERLRHLVELYDTQSLKNQFVFEINYEEVKFK